VSSRSLTALQQIDEADLNALDAFLPSDATERKTLAEIILEKLQDAEDTTEEQSVTQRVKFDSTIKSTRGT
jgi:essential nuclear protein 1